MADRPPETAAGRAARWALTGVAGLGFVYLFIPIATIIAFSFNDPNGRFNLVWSGFTFDNWLHPFANEGLTDAMSYSLRIAVLASAIATILGSLIAIALVRYRFRGSVIVGLLLVLPLTTPEIVLGSSLATLFFDIGWDKGFRTILIAHILFCTSFVALTVKARLRGFDWSLEDAAMDLGATPWRTFRKVTMPLITPGVLAAALLSFALSIDDYIITQFNAGPEDKTFPLQVFDNYQRELPPQIDVLATMILLVSVALLLGGVLLRRRSEQA